MMIRPVHLRMARAALGWSLKELADKAEVNLNTISRYESGSQVMSGTISKIEAVLRKEGIVFFEEEGEFGPGVRLKRQLSLPVSDSSEMPKRGTRKDQRSGRKSRT